MGSSVVVFKRGQGWHYEKDFGLRPKVNRQQAFTAGHFPCCPSVLGRSGPAHSDLKRIATVTLLVARQTVSSWGPPPAGGCLMKGLVHRCSFAFLKPSIIVIG